eukprot:TRINITY_DN57049_c0_g1_i3.p1 TRINITY_DN57049_c0_g1~~TRINITY_DN57049_c0_g1_i3.p1  ORF type:complete len:164 (-),score=18.35 TRINITY_DN57049_c0_g1_i3:44-535(-)
MQGQKLGKICLAQNCFKSGIRRSLINLRSQQRLGYSASAGREGTMELYKSLNLNDAMEVFRIPALSDNYVWLLRDPKSQKVAIVDPGEPTPVVEALSSKQLNLDYILNTHHHWDHTGANVELKKKYGATIVGPKADEDRIPGIDIALKEGETWKCRIVWRNWE